jgi:hypothetical protein
MEIVIRIERYGFGMADADCARQRIGPHSIRAIVVAELVPFWTLAESAIGNRVARASGLAGRGASRRRPERLIIFEHAVIRGRP